MKIAFDSIAPFGEMSKNRGIGNYAIDLLETILDIDNRNEYFFLNLLGTTENYFAKAHETKLFMGKNNILIKKQEYKSVYRNILRKFLRENKVDVFYVTSPFDLNYTDYEIEWFEGVKTVTTVYDIIPYVFKERYLQDKSTYSTYMKRVDFIKKVDHIFAISQSVKDDLINYLNFSPDKITVVYGDISNQYKVLELSETTISSFRKKYGITDKFVMCTGGDDDRKNIGMLIEAYSKLDKELKDQYQLAIVCKLSAESEKRYLELSKRLDIQERVILTNFVPSEDLLIFYNLATLMAFPSQYEGFGLPVIESMACGTPVLTSNNSSLGEIGGKAAVLVDPFSLKDIANGLKYALTEADLSSMVVKGLENRELYRWDTVANKTIDAIGNLNLNESRKLTKVAMFTPLPPIESGISDYSYDIICEISKYVDVDVFIDDGYKNECEFPENVKVFNHSKFKSLGRVYDNIIYQVGNSYYHEYMYKYVKTFPGVLVLHDYNLHGVFQAIALSKNSNNIEMYKEFMSPDLDKEELESYINDLTTGKCSVKIQHIELNGYVVNPSKSIIVHSEYAKKKLLEKNIGTCVDVIPHYTKVEELNLINEAKNYYNINRNTLVISAFGHIHETKRALPILKAFSKVIEVNKNLKLRFVGKLDSLIEIEFNNYVNSHNLKDYVDVTGYVDIEDFTKAIDATDICLNLRYPYNGETSGSLMRILGKGKCVIVNDIGSFSEIPDEACIKLPSAQFIDLEDEVENIFNSLKKLIENVDYRIYLQNNALKYAADKLDIKKVAIKYLDYITQEHINIISENFLNYFTEKELEFSTYSDEQIKMLADSLAYTIM